MRVRKGVSRGGGGVVRIGGGEGGEEDEDGWVNELGVKMIYMYNEQGEDIRAW